MTTENPLELLRTQPLVRYDRRLGGGKLADEYLKSMGITVQERFEINSVLAIAMLVEQGLGIGLVPHIGKVLTQGRLLHALPVPCGSSNAGREVGLLWMRFSPKARRVEQLLQCAEALQDNTTLHK